MPDPTAPSVEDSVRAAMAEVAAAEPVVETPAPVETPAAPDKTETRAAPEKATPERPDAKVDASGRVHAPDGKFAPKPTETKTPDGKTAVTEGEPEKTAAKAPEKAAEAKPADAPFVLPHTLPAAEKAELEKLAALGPEGKAAAQTVVRHLEGMQASYSRAVTELAPAREIMDFFKPYRQQLDFAGQTEIGVIRRWGAAEHGLQNDPISTFKRLAAAYLNPQDAAQAAVLEAINGTGEPAYIDPEIKRLNDEIAGLKQGYGAVTGTLSQHQLAAGHAKLSNFMDAKGADGQLLHPHMNDPDVQRYMAQQARELSQQGRTPDLEQLYEAAIWASPAARAQQQAAIEAKAEARAKAAAVAEAEKAAADKVAAAQRAGGSIRGSAAPGMVNGLSPDASPQESVYAAARQHGAM